MQYNIWYALSYEITNLLINTDARWEQNPWVQKIREYCKPDWVEWKTEYTMKNVDFQAEVIKQQWTAEEDGKYTKPIVIEHKPDGSKAQDLLGGTLEIKAPFYNPDASGNQG
jgi:hypothetical protein